MNMRTIDEIKDLKEYLVTDYHGGRVAEQETDENYYTDNFRPALLKKPALDHPTGEAARQIDLPAEHLITGNPQAFRVARTKGEVEKAAKVAKMQNYWVQRIKRQSPDPFNLSLKMNLKRGEVYVQSVLNEDWTSDNQVGLPVWFHIPDPMIVFPSPKEIDCIPEEVIVSCKRNIAEIARIWPNWKYKGDKKIGDFIAYYSEDQRYFEIDGEVIWHGKNIMKLVPFVHVYTGYGSDSPNSRPEDLAVGRLKHMRSLLDAERTLFSDMMSLIHRFSYGYMTFTRDGEVDEDAFEKFSAEPFKLNLLPIGVKPAVNPTDMLANLNYIQNQYGLVRAKLDRELSPLFEGMMMGSSGRQDDMATANALRRYETVMNNIQILWSVSLSQALKIVDTVPNMLPISIYAEDITDGVKLLKEVSVSKDDINKYYDCTVELKAADTIDQDRNALMYRNAWQAGQISLKTSLVKGWNMTEDQASEEIDDVVTEKVTIGNPVWVTMVGLENAREKNLPIAEVMQMMAGGGAEGQKGRPQEIKTPRGQEGVDGNFQRGGRGSAT